MRLEVSVPEGTKLTPAARLDELHFDLAADIYGEERKLGVCSGFRFDPPVVSFEFEPAEPFGDQLIRDLNSGMVQMSIFIQEEFVVDQIVTGPAVVQFVGRLNVPEPATTACDEPSCGKVFPVMDAYDSLRWPGRQVCPECFEKGQKSKRFKLKEVNDGQEGPEISFGNIPARAR